MHEQAHDSRNMEPNVTAYSPSAPKRKKRYVYVTQELDEKLEEYAALKQWSGSEACVILLENAVNQALRSHYILKHAIGQSKEANKSTFSA